MANISTLKNPQLEGTSFYWKGGSVGVLLCHGLTATTAEVRPLAKELYKQGYTVAGPLLPGHGTTPQDCNQHSWEDWYASVDKVYKQLSNECERVVVGGESTGALLALRLACLNPDAAAILCYAPALKLKLNRFEHFQLTLLAPVLVSVPKSPTEDNNPWQGYFVNPLKAANQLRRLQRVIHPLLPQIRQPILILQGRLDPTVHCQSPQIIYDRVSSRSREFYWLENSTHCVLLDTEWELAARLTTDFLKRVLAN